MKSLILILFTTFTCALNSSAAAPQNMMRFHCESDTIEINAMLSQVAGSGIKSQESVGFFAERFIGRPYKAGTLEGNEELLSINIHEFDCVTFAETCIALAQAAAVSNPSWRDFARNLESIRYRKGEMNGYASRKHYMSEWIADNIYRGNIREITQDFETASMEKTLNCMTKHADSYPALADSVNYAEIKKMEMGYRSHRIPYLKKEVAVKKHVKQAMRNGDIIVILTKEEGLDASHVGLVKIVDGEPHLLHASSTNGKVTLEEVTLNEYFKRNARNAPGIRLLRLAEY